MKCQKVVGQLPLQPPTEAQQGGDEDGAGAAFGGARKAAANAHPGALRRPVRRPSPLPQGGGYWAVLSVLCEDDVRRQLLKQESGQGGGVGGQRYCEGVGGLHFNDGPFKVPPASPRQPRSPGRHHPFVLASTAGPLYPSFAPPPTDPPPFIDLWAPFRVATGAAAAAEAGARAHNGSCGPHAGAGEGEGAARTEGRR